MPKVSSSPAPHEVIVDIPTSKIIISSDPDRFTPGNTSIDELALSIHEHGLLQPILVTPSESDGCYDLIAGQRRLLATISLGLPMISCRVFSHITQSVEVLRLTENLQRQDLSPLEEAVSIKRWRDLNGFTQEIAAERLGKGLSWLKKRESLLNLPDDIMDSLHFGQINSSVALELGRIEDDHVRKYYLQSAVDYGATQDVASVWVTNYLRDGSKANPPDLNTAVENFSNSPSTHLLPCHICQHSFSLSELRNVFVCPSCYSSSAGAARNLKE